jgi:hypothetical protein
MISPVSHLRQTGMMEKEKIEARRIPYILIAAGVLEQPLVFRTNRFHLHSRYCLSRREYRSFVRHYNLGDLILHSGVKHIPFHPLTYPYFGSWTP